MVEEVSITLDNGVTITTVGDHRWTEAVMPGLSRCECGIYRRYDRHQGDYRYSEGESND
jgi:hypothetical protein